MPRKREPGKRPSRKIAETTQNELWGKAAGRCQFPGCNKLLYCSDITLEPVIIAEKAHIYSFSELGPRGHDGIGHEQINNIDNLMLLCETCHTTIDNKNGRRYPIEVLEKWKRDHETRVQIVTGIESNRKTCIVTYTASIGGKSLHLDSKELISSIFPEKFPTSSTPITLSTKMPLADSDQSFWDAESSSLRKLFERYVQHEISNGESDFTLFAIAPQPLLVLLGTLFTDKVNVEVRQLMREPKTWRWQAHPDKFKLNIFKPEHRSGDTPVLCLSISANIDKQRITSRFDSEVDIWTVAPEDGGCGNDIIRCPEQLSHFRNVLRKTIKEIIEQYGTRTPLHVFPAMPVSCAVELGRIRMPKVDMPWIIYDQNNVHNSFIHALTIGDSE